MSQEEIDALIGNGPGPAPEVPPATTSASTPPPPVADTAESEETVDLLAMEPESTAASSVEPPPPSGQTVDSSPDGKSVDLSEVHERLENLEEAVRRVGELDEAEYRTEHAVRQMQQDIKNLAVQLQRIAAHMKAVTSNLQATPGYGAMRTHRCAGCGATGAAAVPIKCANCGKTSYKGGGARGSSRVMGNRPGKGRPARGRPRATRQG